MHNPDRHRRDPGPLADLRVLELGTLIAGPFAGRWLADFGAEVIKVEHPASGDPLRGWGETWNGTESLWHLVQSRGKRSVAADLHDPADQALVRALAAESDILIENFRPGRLEAWNLDPATLMAANPGLIVVRISGYGQTGPLREQPGFGTIAEAAGGLRYLTGEPDRPPARVGLSLGDSIASLHALVGALIALHEREASGRGQVVDVALTEAVFSMLEGVLPEYGYSGTVRERVGNIAHNSAPTNAYPCADGALVCIAANTTPLFRSLFRAIGRDDIADDAEPVENQGRVRRAAELDEAIAGVDGDADGRRRGRRSCASGGSRSAGSTASPTSWRTRSSRPATWSSRSTDERLARPLLVPGVVPKLSRTPGRVPPLGPAAGGGHRGGRVTGCAIASPDDARRRPRPGAVAAGRMPRRGLRRRRTAEVET